MGQLWGSTFRITPKANGFQMVCHLPGHEACQKTRSGKFTGGPDALRLLKVWAVWGIGTESKDAHLAVWDEVLRAAAEGRLPAEAELDAARG